MYSAVESRSDRTFGSAFRSLSPNRNLASIRLTQESNRVFPTGLSSSGFSACWNRSWARPAREELPSCLLPRPLPQRGDGFHASDRRLPRPSDSIKLVERLDQEVDHSGRVGPCRDCAERTSPISNGVDGSGAGEPRALRPIRTSSVSPRPGRRLDATALTITAAAQDSRLFGHLRFPRAPLTRSARPAFFP